MITFLSVLVGSFFIPYLLLCFLAAGLSQYKQRSTFAVFVISVLFTPIIGFIVVLCLQSLQTCAYCKKRTNKNIARCETCGGPEHYDPKLMEEFLEVRGNKNSNI